MSSTQKHTGIHPETTTLDYKLYVIKQACIEANPEIMKGYNLNEDRDLITDGYNFLKEPVGHGREVRLADIFLAVQSEMEVRHEPNHLWFRIKALPEYQKDWIVWDLSKPLEDQSEETITFLYTLLSGE